MAFLMVNGPFATRLITSRSNLDSSSRSSITEHKNHASLNYHPICQLSATEPKKIGSAVHSIDCSIRLLLESFVRVPSRQRSILVRRLTWDASLRCEGR